MKDLGLALSFLSIYIIIENIEKIVTAVEFTRYYFNKKRSTSEIKRARKKRANQFT